MTEKPTYEELERRVEQLERERREWRDVRETLLESVERYERFISTIPCALYDYVRWPDGRNQFIYISPQCERIFELDAGTIVANTHLLWEMVHPDDRERLRREDQAANESGEPFQSEVQLIPPSGKLRWIQLTSMPSKHQLGGRTIWSGVILDITERKLAEEERDRLVEQLRRALAEVKTLQGILPICSYCKKVRDDKGYWNQLEAYLSTHAVVDLSHGICPECVRKYYPDYDVEEE